VKVTVLVGGVGGARFLLGLEELLGLGAGSQHEVTAVVNVGDDVWMHGLRICPDLDTCMYTLGGGVDAERGWGQADETWTVKEELAAYGADPDWFGLGDRDIATHLIRTRMLRAGYPLSAVTEALCVRWQPKVRLLPVTDDRCETHVVIADPTDGQTRAVHFQEWWVRHRAQVPTQSFVQVGAEQAELGPGVTQAIAQAVRGMADACLTVLGVRTTAEAVGRHYGARSGTGLLDGWLVDAGDSAEVPGVQVRSVPLLMTDLAATKQMARSALELAGVTV